MKQARGQPRPARVRSEASRKTNPLSTGKTIAFSVALLWVSFSQALAHGPNTAPELAVKWIPAADLSEVVAVVKNDGTAPLRVDPQMAVLALSDVRKAVPWPDASTRGVIQVGVTPLDSARHPIPVQLVLARPVGYPLEIASGETRKIKVVVEGFPIGPDGGRAHEEAVIFALWRDGKKLTSETFARRRGWRRW